MCVATVCAVELLVGLVAWIVCWKMFLIICCFLLPSVCGHCVRSGGTSGTAGLDCVLKGFFDTILFSVA